MCPPCAHHMCTLPLGLFDCSNRVRSLALLPLVYSTYCRCPSDTGLQLRLMIGLGFTAFLVAAIIVALDLKFGWSQKKGGGRLKPIINAIQSLTVLIMFPAKVRRREEKTQRGRDEERKRPTSCAVTCVCTLLLNSGIPLGSQPACIRQLTTTL